MDSFDDTDVHRQPGTGQADHQPPLQRTAGPDVSGDVQGLTVPEEIDWGALHTLLIQACVDHG